MDVRHITSQPEYSREAVKDEKHKAFLCGYDVAIEELDTFLANEYEVYDESPIVEKIINEVASDIINKAKEWLTSNLLEHQISFIDSEYVDEDKE